MPKKRAKVITRTTVSIPLSLKKQMDDLGRDVNWSEVATAAFRAKVVDLIAQQQSLETADAIARLRLAAVSDRGREYQAGEAAGREWAMREAQPSQLESFVNLDNELIRKDFAHILRAKLGDDAADESAISGFVDAAAGFWSDVKFQVLGCGPVG